jgi:hypothetical protein
MHYASGRNVEEGKFGGSRCRERVEIVGGDAVKFSEKFVSSHELVKGAELNRAAI